MENYLCNIFWITLVTGLFGGLINFLLLDKDELIKSNFFRSIIVGLGASFVVPLFLQTISSELINQCKTDPKNYFVYAGFCLIAAIFSRSFLTTVADKVLKKAEKAERKAEEAVQKADNSAEKVSAFVDKNSEPDDDSELSESDLKPIEEDIKGKVTVDIKNILNALKTSKYAYRTAKGIAKEVSTDEDVVELVLDELEKRKMVSKITNTTNNKIFWTLTEKGNKFKLLKL